MTLYSFTALVSGVDMDDDVQVDALYTGAFDIYPAMIDGQMRMTFEIDAPTEVAAIDQVIEHLCRCGATVQRLDEGLMNLSQIADEVDLSRQAVRKWSEEPRFPPSRTQVSVGARAQRLWVWPDVFSWLQSERPETVEDAPIPVSADRVDIVNGSLAAARQRADALHGYPIRHEQTWSQTPLREQSPHRSRAWVIEQLPWGTSAA